MKKSILVRLAGSSVYSKYIEIDPSKLTGIMRFPKEIFAYIDGVRIAMYKEDYEQLMEEYNQNLER